MVYGDAARSDLELEVVRRGRSRGRRFRGFRFGDGDPFEIRLTTTPQR